MPVSVADRIVDRMPRPVRCDACGSPKIALESRALMGMRVRGPWALIWYCWACNAFVGCHQGTDIPLGLMADRDTREARYRAHKALDPLWRGKRAVAQRAEVYAWIAKHLGISPEVAHISMLDTEQCEKLINGVDTFKQRNEAATGRVIHWKERKRKRRR